MDPLPTTATILSLHGIAAVELRDGVVAQANAPARALLAGPHAVAGDRDPSVDDALAEVGAALTIEGSIDDLLPGESREITVVLGPDGPRDAIATATSDGSSVLVTFAAHDVDPAHVARLEILLASTSDLIVALDRHGRIRFANAAGRRITGYSGDDVVGEHVTSLVHPDDVERVSEVFGRAVTGEAVDPVEYRLRYADGDYRPVEAELTARVAIDDDIFVVTIRDITDRIRGQEEQQAARRRLESLVENLEDVLVVLGEDLSVQWASPGIERLVDAPAYTNVGENAFNDMHPDDIGAVAATIDEVTREPGKSGRVEFRLHHARRGWRWVEAFVVNRLADPDLRGLVCTLRDITERRDIDAELRRLHEQDRAEMERLREADRLKGLFLATVSHELRTPLTTVLGFSRLLTREADDLDPATTADLLDRIHANAAEMDQMIDQILELSRLQAGKIELQLVPIALEQTVDTLLERLDVQLSGHEVVRRLDGLSVLADRNALEHVLRNLLTNAARYSDAGTRIDVEAERHGDTVVLSVRDRGIGIAAEDQARIFESFYQVDPATTGRRGTGIGLNIARRYVQLLSGRLQVTSELGAGSTFSVTLPAAD